MTQDLPSADLRAVELVALSAAASADFDVHGPKLQLAVTEAAQTDAWNAILALTGIAATLAGLLADRTEQPIDNVITMLRDASTLTRYEMYDLRGDDPQTDGDEDRAQDDGPA